ncbi:MAG TPA: hypothetical protein VH912_17885, partial [Streptosporangiaceae bacterium]
MTRVVALTGVPDRPQHHGHGCGPGVSPGPRVGTLLHTTAVKVKPARPRNRRRMIAGALLAVGAMAGTVGAL